MRTPIDSLPETTPQRVMRPQHDFRGTSPLRFAAGGWFVVCLLLAGAICSRAQTIRTPYTFSTLAGLAGRSGSADGTGSEARFFFPSGAAVDSAGNVFVGDNKLNKIRKITAGGVVTTLAGGTIGSADGTGSAAQFNTPFGVAVDNAGNIYVADKGNSTIRMVTPDGVVTTLAGLAGNTGNTDGTGSAARFRSPSGVAVDNSGNVYVADSDNSTIRQVTPGGVVTTLAGRAGSDGSADGPSGDARFNGPTGVAVDNDGNVYVADYFNDAIRKVTSAGVVTTLAGLAGSTGSADGTGGAARFNRPTDVAIDSMGNIYVADTLNQTIRRLAPGGMVTTLAGLGPEITGSTDGTGSAVGFDSPTGVAVDSMGNVYVADYYNYTIRKGSPALILTPYFLANGDFRMLVTGPVDSEAVFYASDNLQGWLPLATNQLTGGTYTFSDPVAMNFTIRFYRASLK